MELPIKYIESMQVLLGDDYPAYINSFDEDRLFGLRINTNKISVEQFLEISPFHLSPIPWVDNGFYYSEEDRPAKHPYYFAGLYYLQEPSAMTPAFVMPIEQGDKVLDLCAAPGGKSTELGSKLKGTGLLFSNDISASRAKGLLKNIEIFGIGNVMVTCSSPEDLGVKYNDFFDKILVDAPCSGEGMFRKDHKLISSWENQGPEYFAPIQYNILEKSSEMLKKDGYLLYSTCTFSEIENEYNIIKFLDNHNDFEIVPIYRHDCPLKDDFLKNSMDGFSRGVHLEEAVRLFPHKIKGEGHFIALLHKKGKEEIPTITSKARSKKVPDEIIEFLKELTLVIDLKDIEIIQEKVYCIPKEIQSLQGTRILRSGMYLGEYKKNRFEPSQALAMILKCEEYSTVVKLTIEDYNVLRYLKGETIEITENQIVGQSKTVLISVDGHPLGWGKINGLTIKNKYSPGWRWM